MKTELYTLRTLSNLHVGSGDINFNVIDNQVQKDPITKLPNINSSSLKGAFREAFRELRGNNTEPSNSEVYIFGQDNKSNTIQAGAYSFFEAQLLTRPVRSNVKPYFNATSPSVIKSFLKTIEIFEIDFKGEIKEVLEKISKLSPNKGKPIIFENITEHIAILEDNEAEYKDFDTSELQSLLGENIALFEDSDFQVLELPLPVLARNVLEDGTSKNIWYEEVVPKQTKFFFFIGMPDNLDEGDKKEKLEKYNNSFMKLLEKPIQIGANKSIGYGFCKIEKVLK